MEILKLLGGALLLYVGWEGIKRARSQRSESRPSQNPKKKRERDSLLERFHRDGATAPSTIPKEENSSGFRACMLRNEDLDEPGAQQGKQVSGGHREGHRARRGELLSHAVCEGHRAQHGGLGEVGGTRAAEMV